MRSDALALALLLIPAQPCSTQQPTGRERWQRVAEVLEAVGARPGAVVADVGAGSGFYTLRLSRAVGAEGRVFAVDIAPSALARLRSISRQPGRDNIVVVEGRADDPRLPSDSLDAVLIVNAYHEMEAHEAMLSRLFAALKPGGRLVLLEPFDSTRRLPTREAQRAAHVIARELAVADLERRGFEVVRQEAGWARDPQRRTRQYWLVVARKPSLAR